MLSCCMFGARWRAKNKAKLPRHVSEKKGHKRNVHESNARSCRRQLSKSRHCLPLKSHLSIIFLFTRTEGKREREREIAGAPKGLSRECNLILIALSQMEKANEEGREEDEARKWCLFWFSLLSPHSSCTSQPFPLTREAGLPGQKKAPRLSLSGRSRSSPLTFNCRTNIALIAENESN